MTVFASSGSARRTNPESRCGRNPTVVRITRSQEARTGARLIGARRDVAEPPRRELVVAHPPRPNPASASPPRPRKVRLFITNSVANRRGGFSHLHQAAVTPAMRRGKRHALLPGAGRGTGFTTLVLFVTGARVRRAAGTPIRFLDAAAGVMSSLIA